jgi:hypothetical protein
MEIIAKIAKNLFMSNSLRPEGQLVAKTVVITERPAGPGPQHERSITCGPMDLDPSLPLQLAGELPEMAALEAEAGRQRCDRDDLPRLVDLAEQEVFV